MEAFKIIDTSKFSDHLRSRGIRAETQEVLVTQFHGSEEERDFSLPANCGGFGRIHHFKRSQGVDWPANPLPIDPACNALKLPLKDSLQVQVFQINRKVHLVVVLVFLPGSFVLPCGSRHNARLV